MNAINKEDLFQKANLAYEADDLNSAEKILIELANSGHIESYQFLGFIYKSEKEKKDTIKSKYFYDEFFRALNNLVHAGDSTAMLSLGRAYQYGDNIEVNEEIALNLFHNAAELGNPDAEFHLSSIYRYGWCGAVENQELFSNLLARSASKKHPEALYIMGLVMKDLGELEQSRQLIEESANLGFFVAKKYLKNNN